jgi:hypothetical protein
VWANNIACSKKLQQYYGGRRNRWKREEQTRDAAGTVAADGGAAAAAAAPAAMTSRMQSHSPHCIALPMVYAIRFNGLLCDTLTQVLF